jgi:hypothetical protein
VLSPNLPSWLNNSLPPPPHPRLLFCFAAAPGDRYEVRVKYFHPMQFDTASGSYVLDLPTVVPTQCLPSGVNVTAVLEASVAIDTGAFDIWGGGGGLEGRGSYVLDLPTVMPTQCCPRGST